MANPGEKPKSKPCTISRMSPQEAFSAIGSSAANWRMEALGLMRAAYVLWREFHRAWPRITRPATANCAEYMLDTETMRLSSCYMLLAGLAAENLAKGLLIAQKTVAIDASGIPRKLKDHRLACLLRTAAITLTQEEALVAEHLSQAVMWQGRYPVPRGPGNLGPHALDALARSFHHPKEVTALLKRIAGQYPSREGEVPVLASGHYPRTCLEWLEWLEKECPSEPLSRRTAAAPEPDARSVAPPESGL